MPYDPLARIARHGSIQPGSWPLTRHSRPGPRAASPASPRRAARSAAPEVPSVDAPPSSSRVPEVSPGLVRLAPYARLAPGVSTPVGLYPQPVTSLWIELSALFASVSMPTLTGRQRRRRALCNDGPDRSPFRRAGDRKFPCSLHAGTERPNSRPGASDPRRRTAPTRLLRSEVLRHIEPRIVLIAEFDRGAAVSLQRSIGLGPISAQRDRVLAFRRPVKDGGQTRGSQRRRGIIHRLGTSCG